MANQKMKLKHRNQRNDVLSYLQEYGSITQLEAYRCFPAPITRLSAVIFDLNKRPDVEIVGYWEEKNNCYGTVRYKRYKLLKTIK